VDGSPVVGTELVGTSISSGGDGRELETRATYVVENGRAGATADG
jgi:hypothetical protein